MKKKNNLPRIDKHFYASHRCKTYASPSTIYQSADGETSDVTQAIVDNHGRPVVLRRDAKNVKPANYFPRQRLTFNPNNPSARLIAMEARAMVQSVLPPTIYEEKFDAVKRADNTAQAFEEKYNKFIDSSKYDKNGNT